MSEHPDVRDYPDLNQQAADFDYGHDLSFGAGEAQGAQAFGAGEDEPAFASWSEPEDASLAYDEEEDEDEEDEAPAPRRRRPMLLLGLLGAGLVGMGAYFHFVAPGEGGESPFAGIAASFPISLPFLGPRDSEETRAMGQDNAMMVRRAIDAYARTQGRLPKTAAAITAQLTKLGLDPRNPYHPEEPAVVTAGPAPTSPGEIAYDRAGMRYTLRVGDVAGGVLTLDDAPYELTGRLGAHTKRRQAAAPARPGAPAVAPDAKADPVAAFVTAHTAPSPSPSPKNPTLTQVRKNQEFDYWRNRGIALVYGERTVEAIAAFKKAQGIKPDDASIKAWLDVIEEATQKHKAELMKKRYEDLMQLMQGAGYPTPEPARP